MNWLCQSKDSEKFWDLNRTWYADSPDFSWCFQSSILNWIPCFFLALASPFYFVYLRRHGRGYIRMSQLHKSKTCLGLLLALLCYMDLFYTVWNVTHHVREAPVSLISPLLLGFSMLLAVCLIQYERIQGVQSSGVLFLFWLLALLCAIVQLRSKILWALRKDAQLDAFRYVIFPLYFVLVLAQFILSTLSDQPPFFCDVKDEPNQNPETRASFLSRITFGWFTGLMLKGYKQPLEEDDIWSLRKSDRADSLVSDFAKAIAKERNKRKQIEVQRDHRKTQQNGGGCEAEVLIKCPKMEMDWKLLLKIICKAFGLYYLLASLFMVLFTLFIFITPQILRWLLTFSKDPAAPSWQGFLCAALLFVCPCAQSLCIHHHDYVCCVTGMRLKSAVVGCVYRKALIISHAGRKNSSAGEIVNLISSDIQKLMDLATCLNYMWSAPLTIAVAMYFLWQTLGVAVLAGVAVFFLNVPLMIVFGVKVKKLQEEQMKNKDSRIKLMTEILQGIKVLKLYAWENAFMTKIRDIRDRELKSIKMSALLIAAAVAVFMTVIFWVSLAMFGVYLHLDEKHVLDAQKAFVTLLLLNILRLPLRYFPLVLSLSMQSLVALKRLVKFFCEDEIEPSNVDKICTSSNEIRIENGTFSWSAADSPCLRSININIPRGSLVAVVGHVGCGKTSLLSTLLGEMKKLEGHVAVKDSVAYVPQQAWIPNATFKENVLFGRKLEQNWYNAVLQACALLPDLKILPAGEETEIGEKGVNLSGGQKQRISFARAVYRKSDVYLLDDPLSAVDAHVGQHIFENVIGPRGLLQGKTRVLVTHGISFLPQVDTIIVMVDGRISEMGSYRELLQQDGAFADFLQTFATAKQNGCAKDERDEKSSEEEPVDSYKNSSRNNADTPMKSVMTNEEKEKAAGVGKLTEADRAHTGRVKLAVYLEYCKVLGGFYLLLIMLLSVTQQTAASCYNYWIGLWADDPIVNGTQQHTQLRLGVYSFLGIIQGFGLFATSAAVILGGVSVSRHLHSKLLHSVLRCPLSFFERTPSGNLTNRFAKEMDTIDTIIPHNLMMSIIVLLTILEILLVIAVATPLAAVTFLPLGLLYFFLQRFYLASSRQLQRLESVSKSPLYTQFNETLQGIGIIRAFGEQNRFIQATHTRLDTNQQLSYSRFVANRWLSIRLDLLGNCIVFTVAIIGVIFRESIGPGLVGLAVVNSLRLTQVLNMAVHTATDLETNTVAVERVKEYCDVEPEAAWTSGHGSALGKWPQEGRIEFNDYGLRYRNDLELALKNITVAIQKSEKVGIVGRTGAGKSSFTMGLFRIIEAAAGQICIDGIDISTIGLHDLRSRITIIPQDPVLFLGSLRMNLDPFANYCDDDIWTALELAHLKSFVTGLPEKLDYECSEGGENLSVGQRQLVCLARALLRKTKILVLDEATAAVDLETDNLIQSTIRIQFKDCTVITIAHRLNTIMDYSRVLVFDKGQIVEFDTPANLLEKRGLFHNMAKDAGLL
ncbi:multidrug resistance-associated protein 1-like isoform X2 [Rhinatrema bivittatum]|uniref:multidrug resistance-associated protein 1-like isoform X2 n=1 Tax=Rhinatrema bivittatum TaxID=194408 RepID=UPI00112AA0F9|nr:multidrug resistance-associated protein 1-like isoform X2 [Rhinatrema bivittatum]